MKFLCLRVGFNVNTTVKKWIIRGVTSIITPLIPFILIVFGAVTLIFGASTSGADSPVLPPDIEGDGIFGYPVPGYIAVSSPFGYRTDPFSGQSAFHKGIDFPAPFGTEVVSAFDGIVEFSDWNSQGFGYLVIIKHDDNTKTYYAHNSKLYLSPGDVAPQGRPIAQVGSTGDSTGNHCHFELRIGGEAVDPFPYLQPAQSTESEDTQHE